MLEITPNLTVAAAAVGSVPVALFGRWIANRFICFLSIPSRKHRDTLIATGEIDHWNELRDLDPDWKPSFDNLRLRNISADEANFKDANFNKCYFEYVSFLAADFSNSTLNDVEFDNVDLTFTMFEDTKLSSAVFIKARVSKALADHLEELGAEFTDPIFVDEGDSTPLFSGEELSKFVNLDPVSNLRKLTSRQMEVLLEHWADGANLDASGLANTGSNRSQIVVQPKASPEKYFVSCVRARDGKVVGAARVRSFGRYVSSMRSAGEPVMLSNGTFNREAVNAASHYGIRLIAGEEWAAVATGDKSVRAWFPAESDSDVE